MEIFYKRYFRFFILLLINTLILRGYNVAANEPINPRPNVEEDVKGKTLDEVYALANKYSFTNMPLALQYCNKAIEIAKASGDLNNVFDAQRLVGFIYEDNAQFDKALQAHYLNIDLVQKLDASLQTALYNDLAILNRKIGNFRESFNWYDKILATASQTKDSITIEEAYHGIGLLHKEVGIYDKAIEYLYHSLKLSEQLKNYRFLVVSEIDIAETYKQAQEIDKALEHIEKAYQYANLQYTQNPKEEESIIQQARVLNVYGTILATRKDYQGALNRLQESLQRYQTFNIKPYIAKTLLDIASIYLEMKNYDKSKETLYQCKQYESNFSILNLTEFYHKLGTYYIETHNDNEAEKYFLKSLKVASKYDFKLILQKINYQMFLIHLNRHDNKKALEYLNTAQALSDTLFNVAKAKRTAEAEFKFDNEKREKELQAYKLRENDLKLRENKIFLISSVILFAVVVLFLGYTIQMRGKNIQAMQNKNSEIQQQYRKLEESNEILSQFAYVAAHDLKEPLRSIGSYIGLIQMRYSKDLPDDAKEYMKFVNNGVKRMYSLLTDLLDFSQVISQQPSSELIRPNDILMDVQDNLRSAIDAKNAQIIYNTDLPTVRMNRLHMTQLFQNLIGNALKFTDKNPIVKVEAKEENGSIVLTIEDNGIGIKKEYASKVFVLFQQLNKKEHFEGTGIGLTICKNIVEKYNGKIWFDSEENKGTKFYISIPAAQAA